MRSFFAAALLCGFVLVPANAEAKKHKSQRDSEPSPTIKLLLEMKREIATLNLRLERAGLSAVPLPRGRAVVSTDMPMPRRNPLAVAPMTIPDASKTLKGYERQIARSAKLKDLTPALADKVAAILVNCPGSRLTSGYRRGARVRGSGRPSLHSHYPSKAADLAGNPGCIRKQLAAWPGGLSTDYAAVNHYHVSYDPKGREWGARFRHYGGQRYARKQQYRVALSTRHEFNR